jgi:hypothetical protein
MRAATVQRVRSWPCRLTGPWASSKGVPYSCTEADYSPPTTLCEPPRCGGRGREPLVPGRAGRRRHLKAPNG